MGQTIDVAAVEAHLRDLHARWDVAEIAYDPAYFHRSAEVLADDGLCMLEYPQSAASDGARLPGRLRVDQRRPRHPRRVTGLHRPDPVGGAPPDRHRVAPVEGASRKRKIDAAIALVMALSRATERHEEPPPWVPLIAWV